MTMTGNRRLTAIVASSILSILFLSRHNGSQLTQWNPTLEVPKAATLTSSYPLVVEENHALSSTNISYEASVVNSSSNFIITVGASEINTTAAKSSTCIKPRPLAWEWNYYSNQSVVQNQRKSKRLLIGLYSGYDKYAEMLEMTAPINKAYARKWNQDLVVLQGTAYTRPIDKNCTPPGRRVTLNKIALLLRALERKDQYDQFLLLDTDALMYDFETDVTTLLSDEDMVAAERVKQKDGGNRTWNINAGVMLWNLHHPLSQKVIRAWKRVALRSVKEGNFQGDQKPLQKVLKQGKLREQVSSLWEEFAYGHGTVVKHFIRVKTKDWNDPNLVDERMPRIKQAAADVHQKYADLCDQVKRVEYATTS
jgi:hypothetical protein